MIHKLSYFKPNFCLRQIQLDALFYTVTILGQ